jgi:hypothetical protein
MSEETKTASPFTFVIPLVACPAGVAFGFVPYSGVLSDVLLFGPLPALVYLHWKGKRGGWSIAGLIVAALPYVAVVESIVSGRPRAHIPL